MIVYRTENKVNGKFYYGVHNGTNDNYLGSGKLLKWAISKYGRENFIRRTIKEFDTADEAYAFERLLVDSDFVNRDDCYNVTEGGNKPPTNTGHSEETKRKIGDGNRGKLVSQETKNKNSLATLKMHSEGRLNNWTTEKRNNHSLAMKAYWAKKKAD